MATIPAALRLGLLAAAGLFCGCAASPQTGDPFTPGQEGGCDPACEAGSGANADAGTSPAKDATSPNSDAAPVDASAADVTSPSSDAAPVDASATDAACSACLPPPWKDADVGAVGAKGSASYAGGTFTVEGAGADIYAAADAFNYVYQTVSGDVTVVAKVDTLGNTNPYAKAGVMIRQSLDPAAPFAAAMLWPSGGAFFLSRASSGGTAQVAGLVDASPPQWVKAQRQGTTLSGFYSADGTTWTLLGTSSVAMNDPVYVGLAVTSHSDPTLAISTFEGVSVTSQLTGDGGGSGGSDGGNGGADAGGGDSGGTTATCPTGYVNFAVNGGVADHVGDTFGGCTGSGLSEDCVVNHPVTCTTTAGSNSYTITGYTPTSADVHKHLTIGMALGIGGCNSANCTVGAGGSSYSGQPLRVEIASVSGQTIVGSTFTGGSGSASAANSVTNAECSIETDNSPAMQALAGAGDDVCVPPGDWGFDSSVQAGSHPFHLYCLPGAVLHFDKNDRYIGDYFGDRFIQWQGASGGGVDGCVTLGTNTGIYWRDTQGICGSSGFGIDPPDTNHFYTAFSCSGLTFQNMVDIGMWGDSDISLSIANDSNPGSNNNTVRNVFSKNGWSAGPAIIAGQGNMFTGIVTRNTGIDIEPNNDTEAGKTSGNTVTGNFAVEDSTFVHPTCGYGIGWSTGGGPACSGNATCYGGESVTDNAFQGDVEVFPACVSGAIKGPWSSNTNAGSNATGSPTCACGNGCF